MWYKYSIIALLGAGLMTLAGCQKMEEGAEPARPGKFTLTVTAVKAQTKALEESMGNVAAKWSDGEQVAVYVGGTHLGDLTVEANGDGSQAKLSGTLSSAPEAGQTLTLLYPGRADEKWDYTGQKGVLLTEANSIEKKYDYALASLTVDSIDGTTVRTTSSSVKFENQQNIFCLGFTVKDDALTVKTFTVSSDYEKLVQNFYYDNKAGWTPVYVTTLTVTPATATDQLLYFALRNDNTEYDDCLQFNVTDNDEVLYTGSKKIDKAFLSNGQFLTSDKKVEVTAAALMTSSTPTSDPKKIW